MITWRLEVEILRQKVVAVDSISQDSSRLKTWQGISDGLTKIRELQLRTEHHQQETQDSLGTNIRATLRFKTNLSPLEW